MSLEEERQFFKSLVEFEGKRVDREGNIYWIKNKKYHRENGPAVISKNGAESWYLNGVYHRIDGPAYIDKERGAEVWYLNGVYHRIGGPAIKKKEKEQWCINGKLHREDGPAVIETWVTNGLQYRSKHWYKNGKLHNLNGPAYVRETTERKKKTIQEEKWFIDSIEYTEEEYKEQILIRQLAGIK